MSKKDYLAAALFRSGGLSLGRFLGSSRSDELCVLAYHRVFDVPDEATFPYDLELISASSQAFRLQMEQLKRYFSPVNLGQVLRAIDGDSTLPCRPVLVTFDDGHADNYTHAFPVLRALGVPATIFLSTNFLGTQKTFWFDHVSNLIFRARSGVIKLPGSNVSLPLDDVASRRRASCVLLRQLMLVPDVTRLEQIEWLVSQLGDALDPNDIGMSGALTWEQVKEMADAGIEFGSHTLSHPILAQLDDSSLDHELKESRRIIAERIGRSVETIAYPVGGHQAFDERVIAAVRRAGYRIGFSYLSGTNHLNRLERFALRRLHVERYTNFPRFCAMLEFPSVFQ